MPLAYGRSPLPPPSATPTQVCWPLAKPSALCVHDSRGPPLFLCLVSYTLEEAFHVAWRIFPYFSASMCSTRICIGSFIRLRCPRTVYLLLCSWSFRSPRAGLLFLLLGKLGLLVFILIPRVFGRDRTYPTRSVS